MTITNLHYQRAKPSPLWSRLCPGIRIGRGLARIPQFLCGKAKCGGAPGVPASHGASWRRTGGEMVVRAPRFFAAGAAPGRGRWCTRMVTPSPVPLGGRYLQSDPTGEGCNVEDLDSGCTAQPGFDCRRLQSWLSPWLALGVVARLDLIQSFAHACPWAMKL